MSTSAKSRILYGAADELRDKLVAEFIEAYEANNKPQGMAMFDHCDGLGKLMAVSITPASIPYCPFSNSWSEVDVPGGFGNLAWVSGDERFKTW